jgi:hypothetical protein
VQHEADATVIDGVCPPGSLREKAGEIRFVGVLEDATDHIGQALVGENEEPRQIVLNMPKSALVLKLDFGQSGCHWEASNEEINSLTGKVHAVCLGCRVH